MKQFVNGHAKDAAIDRRHPFQPPVLRVLAHQLIQPIDVAYGAPEELTGEIFHFAVGLALGEKCGANLFRRVAPHLPLEEHLHCVFAGFSSGRHGLMTVNFAGRFSRKARVPSFISAVVQQRPKKAASRNCPSAEDISIPWLTASSANFMASGALAMIFCANFSAAASSSAAGTTWFTRPRR